MSRLAVRQAFEIELKAFLALLLVPVPYYQSINESHNPKDVLWVTCDYFSDYSERLCYNGGKRVEYGAIDVNIFAKGGTGYNDAVSLADSISDHFNCRDLGGGVEIIDTNGVDELTVGDARPVYGVALNIDYQYYY